MIEELLIYQQADSNLRKIETELGGSEERKKAVSAKKYLEGVEEAVNKLDARAAGLASQFELMNTEREKLAEQEKEFSHAVASVEDDTEASYLIKKIDELTAKIRALAAKSEKIAEDMQSVMKEYAGVKNTARAAQSQYAEYGQKYNELKQSKSEERKKIEKELSELAKKVEPSLMERYLKKRAAKIYPIVYEVNDHVCGACNMELPMAVLNRLKNGEIIDCDQCGRLLYKK